MKPVNTRDRLWPNRDTPDSRDERRRVQQQYAEDLKQQILSKQKDKNGYNDNSKGYTNNVSKPSPYSFSPNYKDTQRYSSVNEKTIVNPRVTYQAPQANPFVQVLMTRIEDQKRSASSAMSTIPLSSAPPEITPGFMNTLVFDEAKVNFSPFSSPSRKSFPNPDFGRINPISMSKTVSIRSDFDRQVESDHSISQGSPLRNSKISTPSSGFSMRNNNKATSRKAVSNLSETWPKATTVEEESEMIFPDGRRVRV